MVLEKKALGRRIAELRDRAHLTQPVAADRVGVSLRGYQKWESGETKPGWSNIERLAAVFGVSTEDVVGDADLVEPQQFDELLSEVKAMRGELQALLGRIEASTAEDLKRLVEQRQQRTRHSGSGNDS